MRRFYIFVFTFSITAALMIYVKYSDEMNVKNTQNEWAEIIKIEKVERPLPKLGMQGTYIFHQVTVKLADGSTPTLRVESASNLKKHDCLPVQVSLFFSGDKLTSVNHQQWLFSDIKKSPC